MITIVSAPPYLTVQDLGRPGHRASGVPPSGVMDAQVVCALNEQLGNAPNTAVLEWAIAGGALRFERAATIVVGGADIVGTLGGQSIIPHTTHAVFPGSELRVERFLAGRFFYVAVRGGIDVSVVLGSRSTNVMAGFGGLEGRRLRRDDVLAIGTSEPSPNVSAPSTAAALSRSGLSDEIVRVVRGPQHALFGPDTWSTFLGATFTVAHASDRMGYRLDGPSLHHSGDAALASEPTCVGAVQGPHGGSPIVLMPDGPTIGGYPKIAVVVRADLSHLAQRMPGAPVRFTLIRQET